MEPHEAIHQRDTRMAVTFVNGSYTFFKETLAPFYGANRGVSGTSRSTRLHPAVDESINTELSHCSVYLHLLAELFRSIDAAGAD